MRLLSYPEMREPIIFIVNRVRGDQRDKAPEEREQANPTRGPHYYLGWDK